MSSSEPNSKIDLDDSDEIIKDKIQKAFATDKVVGGNGLMAILKFIVFRKLESQSTKLKIERDERWGGNIEYSNYEALEKDFVEGMLSSIDLKSAVSSELIKIISPIRQKIIEKKALVEEAYPKVI